MEKLRGNANGRYLDIQSHLRPNLGRQVAWIWLLLICLSAVFCQGYTTDELLDGKFIARDLTPVDLLSPSDKAVTSNQPVFVWGKRNGVKVYRLQISAAQSFGSLILNKDTLETTYTLQTQDLIGAANLDSTGYYWRVVAQYSDRQVVSGVSIFHIVSQTVVYVDVNSVRSEQVGNKMAPYKKIQAAIEAADTLRGGLATTQVAVDVAAGTYNEEITLKPGISLFGGYSASDWGRNIAQNISLLQSPTGTCVRGNILITTAYTATTIVDGFSLTANTTGNNYGFYLVDSSPTISNNSIDTNTGSAGYGVYTTVTGSATTAEPVILRNSIRGSGSFNGYGIYVGGGLLVSAPKIHNNVILSNGLSNYGIYISGSYPVISNNTIGAVGNSVFGIYIVNAAGGSIRNNIIFGTGTSTCIMENSASSDPSSVQNNNLFGCTNALYRDNDTATNVTNLTTSITLPTGTLGSMGNISIGNAGNQLFVNMNGADSTLSTMNDNDWRLTTNAAICDVRAGGLDLSSLFLVDKIGISRTTTNLAGCTPGNTGAANWSIGAYEND